MLISIGSALTLMISVFEYQLLTTRWACGVIGLAVGAGFYEGALIATALVLITETVFSIVGRKIPHSQEHSFCLVYTDKEALNDVMRYFKDNRMMIGNLEITGKADGDTAEYSAALLVRSRAKIDIQKITDHIRGIKGIVAVKAV